jgi:hypothetical protein
LVGRENKIDVHHLSVLWASGRDPSGYEFWSPQPTTKINTQKFDPTTMVVFSMTYPYSATLSGEKPGQ